jgi:probable phosphoglycerate mutase
LGIVDFVEWNSQNRQSSQDSRDGEIQHRKTLWLVRHGESTWNVQNRVQGQADEATLTNWGRHQAEQLADSLSAFPVSAVFASDLGRARETATIIAGGSDLPVHLDARLRERCFGVLEGESADSLTAEVTGIGGDGGNEVVDVKARPEGGESLDEMFRRTRAFVEGQRRHGCGDVIVVGHGGSIRTIRAYCAGLSAREMAWNVVANCSVWPTRLPPFPVALDLPPTQLTSGAFT